MLHDTVYHLLENVLPSAVEYHEAETALSLAYAADSAPTGWDHTGRRAARKAAHLAIDIDGLIDRCAIELSKLKPDIRTGVASFCVWPGTTACRADCIERVRGVANAYKHLKLSDPSLPISSFSDVLVVGSGWGEDAYGVGKYGGVEVLVRDKTGNVCKFSGDALAAVVGWFRFLTVQGATVPRGPFYVGGLRVHP